MPLITEIIPKQGFEVVGELIGGILTSELDNQKTLQLLTDSIEVRYESTIPYDFSNDILVNVLWDGAKYDNHTPTDMHGENLFFIDVYANAKTTSDKKGDEHAQEKIKKYMGMARYILSSTKYKLLGSSECVAGTYVQNMQVFDVENFQDARNVRMARMTFMVRIYEGQQLWQGLTLEGLDTNVKLQNTDDGYKYELINS